MRHGNKLDYVAAEELLAKVEEKGTFFQNLKNPVSLLSLIFGYI